MTCMLVNSAFLFGYFCLVKSQLVIENEDWISCKSPKSCQDLVINDTFRQVTCDSSESCIGGDITVPARITCYGLVSCSNVVKLESFRLYPLGVAGAFMTGTDDIIFEDYRCQGFLSCAFNRKFLIYPSFDDDGSINCQGSQSCMKTHIEFSKGEDAGYTSSAKIDFDGAFAGYGSVIDTRYIDYAFIDVDGYYGGFKSDIYCREGSYCTINCLGNGCFGMTLHCLSNDSNCIVLCDDYDDVCPIVIRYNNNGNMVFESEDRPPLPSKYSLSSVGYYLNDLISYGIEDYYQFIPDLVYLEDNFLDQVIELRADTTSGSCDVVCDVKEDSRCYEKRFDLTSGNLCCPATDSCDSMNLFVLKNENVTRLLCDGYGSCERSTIEINSNYFIIFALGSWSLFGSQIVGEDVGLEMNLNNNININTQVICGDQSCVFGNIININKVVCEGIAGCAFEQLINVPMIFGVSRDSLKNSMIIFNSETNIFGTNLLEIWLGNFESTNNETIISCDLNTICTIYCTNLGCDDILYNRGYCSQCTYVYLDELESDDSLELGVGSIFGVDRCDNDPCDCDDLSDNFEDEHCSICNSNGCSECENDYFKKSFNYPCLQCQEIFGKECLHCQDFNGCGQCKEGYLIKWHEEEGLNYCVECGEMFGMACTKCNDNECYQCENGYVLKQGYCVLE